MTESHVWLKQKGQNLPIAASPSLLVRKWILDQMKNDAPPPQKKVNKHSDMTKSLNF